MSSTQVPLPVLDKSDGTPGSAPPPLATQVAGTDGTLLRTIQTDTSGNQIVSLRIPLTPAAPTFATIGTSSTLAVAANASRRGLILSNTSGAKIGIAFGASSASATMGIVIQPSGQFIMDAFTFTTLAINAIASGGASNNLAIQEFT